MSESSTILIQPTIGRRVWYRPNDSDRTTMNVLDDQPLDAGVVYVHNDRLVNLVVTDHVGVVHKRPGVKLVQADDEGDSDGGFCEWMPYQAAQARKST